MIFPRFAPASTATALLFALTASACAAPSSFGPDRLYRHRSLGYRVVAEVPDPLRWRLDNYQLDPAGRPTAPKEAGVYSRLIRVDGDGDGDAEITRQVPTYDLLYTARRDAGRMFLSNYTLGARRADTDLAILARLYVEAVSGGGIEVQQLEGGSTAVERRFATRIVSEHDTTLDGAAAREVVFEVANIDQLELDPTARWERARIVLARPGLVWSPMMGQNNPTLRLPLLVVIGYSNHPDEYAAGESDYEAWLANFRFTLDVPQAVSERVLACMPDARVVPVVTHVSGMNELIGGTPEQNRCVAAAVSGVARGARSDRSWVFTRHVAPAPTNPVALTSGGESPAPAPVAPAALPTAPAAPAAP